MKTKRRNALAKVVRTPVFRQRVVTDKRSKARRKQAEQEAREGFRKCSGVF